MNFQLKNDLLLSEYEKYHAELLTKFDEETKKSLSQPILIHVFPKYDTATRKIMFVGQETKDWCGKLSDTDISTTRVIDEYKKFELAKTYRYRNSPFWRFNRTFYSIMNSEHDINEWPTGYISTNLSKVDQDGKGVNQIIRSKNKAGYELLKKEIEIIKPEILIFLTSWKEDETLKATFDNISFEQVENVDYKYLIRVKSKSLPYNTFRTYHPRFLNNSKHSKYVIADIIDLIKYNCG